jgi:hypothetical protein
MVVQLRDLTLSSDNVTQCHTDPRAWTEVLDLLKMTLGKWNNITMGLKETEWTGLILTDVVWNRDMRRVSVNTVVNYLVSYNAWFSSTSWGISSRLCSMELDSCESIIWLHRIKRVSLNTTMFCNIIYITWSGLHVSTLLSHLQALKFQIHAIICATICCGIPNVYWHAVS